MLQEKKQAAVRQPVLTEEVDVPANITCATSEKDRDWRGKHQHDDLYSRLREYEKRLSKVCSTKLLSTIQVV